MVLVFDLESVDEVEKKGKSWEKMKMNEGGHGDDLHEFERWKCEKVEKPW
jgi:hypothetical protein